MNQRKLIASILLLLATLSWGLSYAIQTITADQLQTFTIVFFKGIGGLILLPLLIRGKKHIGKKEIIGGVLIGLAASVGCILQQRGMELSTVSKASFITALYIVFVPLIESFRGKRPGIKMLTAVGVALAGLYFLCLSGQVSLNVGDPILLAGSFFFALQIVFIDIYSRECDGIVLTLISQLTAAFLSGIVMITVEKPTMLQISQSLLPILYLAVISGGIAQCIQIVYQKDVGPSLASLIMSMESVFGAAGGWLLLSQTMNGREIFGAVLVFVAVMIAEE
ncbi:MAG: DMT family transporter [Erysipelotrichaceae bacterium]|nr:DMT family transporter [Erysipelotrichaceae bacterium]